MGNAASRDTGAHEALEQCPFPVRSEIHTQYRHVQDAHYRPHSHLNNSNNVNIGYQHMEAAIVTKGGAPGGGQVMDGVDPPSRVESSESMDGNTPPESPGQHISPLMFSPQVPLMPITREGELGYNWYLHQNHEAKSPKYQREQGILALFQWPYGGDEVYIEGSWDDWQSRTQLQKVGNEFSGVKVLPPGVYQVRFVVNGEMRYSPDMPFTMDKRGFVKNILHVQEHIPDNVESVSEFELPPSPDVSYDSFFPIMEDINKEPPPLPSQLHVALLNIAAQANVDGHRTLPRPQHVVLNHLYVEKGRTSQSVLGLGLTHRFRSKHVTFVLYKPLEKRAWSENI